MSGNLRREVLRVFKLLHKTRKHVFEGDERALQNSRAKINDEYRKHKKIQDANAITEMNKFALEVEHELRTTIVRLVEKKPGVYEAQITPDTVMADNAKLPQFGSQRKSRTKDVNSKK